MAQATAPFYGQATCQKAKCRNKAYWNVGGQYLCGVHSRKRPREALPKDPDAAIKRHKQFNDQKALVEVHRKANEAEGKRGQVTCCKFLMMREVEDQPGFLKVFPNFKHQTRKDGFGCMTLSPKSLGPVRHSEQGLPEALTIENWHQVCVSHSVKFASTFILTCACFVFSLPRFLPVTLTKREIRL